MLDSTLTKKLQSIWCQSLSGHVACGDASGYLMMAQKHQKITNSGFFERKSNYSFTWNLKGYKVMMTLEKFDGSFIFLCSLYNFNRHAVILWLQQVWTMIYCTILVLVINHMTSYFIDMYFAAMTIPYMWGICFIQTYYLVYWTRIFLKTNILLKITKLFSEYQMMK